MKQVKFIALFAALLSANIRGDPIGRLTFSFDSF